jgi:hypothetical protein
MERTLEEAEGLVGESDFERGEAGLDVERIEGGGVAGGNSTTTGVMKCDKRLDVRGGGEREPGRRGVSEDRATKGFVESGERLLRWAPRGAREGFKSPDTRDKFFTDGGGVG